MSATKFRLDGRIALDGDTIRIDQDSMSERFVAVFGQHGARATIKVMCKDAKLGDSIISKRSSVRRDIIYDAEVDFAGTIKVGEFTLAELLLADFGGVTTEWTAETLEGVKSTGELLDGEFSVEVVIP